MCGIAGIAARTPWFSISRMALMVVPAGDVTASRRVAGRSPERVFEIEMYEPFYYQGFDPAVGLDAIPRDYAPFRPGEARIEVYRVAPN